MKKKKGPLILICVLVLLLILYFVLRTWNKKQDSKEEETVKVTDLKTSKITGVKYDLGTGEMNFEKELTDSEGKRWGESHTKMAWR